jgi:hypothetical protein
MQPVEPEHMLRNSRQAGNFLRISLRPGQIAMSGPRAIKCAFSSCNLRLKPDLSHAHAAEDAELHDWLVCFVFAGMFLKELGQALAEGPALGSVLRLPLPASPTPLSISPPKRVGMGQDTMPLVW